MRISVVIPTYNEEEYIGQLIDFIYQHGGETVHETIVVDSQSTDHTQLIAAEHGAKVLISPIQSRAAQMNLGAKNASGEIFYFVHADVKLLKSFASDIIETIQSGSQSGCYRFQFDSPRRILKANAYFTRFNRIMCRGGDQTLFISREIFQSLGGFNEYFVIMEDYDFIQRLQKRFSFRIIPKYIIVSSRKYDHNSWLRVQIANLTIFIMYFLKRPPKEMASLYKKMLNYR